MSLPTIPINPPAAWFTPPESGIPTDKRVTITADGRVYGYVALWNACHVGMEGCVAPPKGSPSDYDLAHAGETLTAEGSLVKTANIGGGTGHAGADGTPQAAVSHYDNTATQLMRVHYGEDEQGLWFAGALWPDVNELDVQRIRATALSGDWRWVAGYRQSDDGYDFTGAVLVNIPGFPLEADGGVSTKSGFMVDIAASLKADALSFARENEARTLNTGGSMSDCKCKDSKVAAIVEPLDPAEVAGVIEEIIAKHAIQSVEELISILRPKAEGDVVEANTVEEDAPPADDVEDEVTAAGRSKYTQLQASIDNLTNLFADYLSSRLAEKSE